VLLLLLLPLILVLAGLAAPLPAGVELPPTGLDILDRHGRLLYQAVDAVRGASRPVRLAAIAPSLRLATIAVEDASFESNPGVDLLASFRALAQNISAGHIVSGGSTITQQLARLRYLPTDQRTSQSLDRKLVESWLAVRLTQTLGKETVLEQYLNSAPYGNLAVGVEAAAWTYFGRPARELSLAEAALLAGLPQAPTDYDPFTHPAAARGRQQVVLDLMLRRGMLTPTEVETARAEPLDLNTRPFPLSAAHFVDYVRGIAPAGAARIWTTLDRDVQAMAERAAQRQVARLTEHDVSDAAVVVLDPTSGEVQAMVGGVDYFDAQQPAAQVNMAVSARQPGSAFKPITYAAALESGRFSLASMLQDERTVFRTRGGENYVPENYDHTFHGTVPLRVALGSSLNVPAVQVLSNLGLAPVLGLADDLGLHLGDPQRFDLSLTLGGAEVSLLDLTAAYGAFATDGVFHPPVTITRAEDADGRPLVVANPDSAARRVLSPETAWLIDDVLRDDAARGPGFGRDGVLHVPGRDVAVKTGTTSDFRDNWTIGFTPDVVVGVWVGNADNHPMRDVSGVSGAAPLWRDVLDGATGDQASSRFQRPADLVQVTLCADSAAVAGPDCAAHRLEWLMSSTIVAGDTPTRVPLRVAYPDSGTAIVLDPTLPVAAQQVPIEIEADGAVSDFQVLVDGVAVGARSTSGPVGWPPTLGRHVIRAIGRGVESGPVEIEVVPS
jgi:penicillin-binding protein 1C